MKSLKGSETEKNLLKAFAGESQARNRYTYFASVARKEGYEQISAIFLETADNEKEHAKVFFKYLEGGNVEITAAYPAGMAEEIADYFFSHLLVFHFFHQLLMDTMPKSQNNGIVFDGCWMRTASQNGNSVRFLNIRGRLLDDQTPV